MVDSVMAEQAGLAAASALEPPASGRGWLLGKGDVRLCAGKGRARGVPDIDTVPSSVDVVVIGGGMVGAMAALTLAQRGVSVALCEKGSIAGEASGRAMGLIYSQFADPAKQELVVRSKELWRDMSATTGRETGYIARGHLITLETEALQAPAEEWVMAMRGMPGFDSQILSGAEVQAMFPTLAVTPRAALFTPSDGAAEPVLAVPAIAEAAREKGAIILQNLAVRAIETAGGRISGVATEKGSIACQSVILAAGAWTPHFTRSLGIRYVQSDVYMSLVELAASSSLASSISAAGFGIRRQHNGRYSFGAMSFAVPIMPGTLRNIRALMPTMKAFADIAKPGLSVTEFSRDVFRGRRMRADRPSRFEGRRVLQPAYNSAPTDAALVRLREHFPDFANSAITEHWAGAISTTLDNMPAISAVPSHPGLFVGSGFTNGFTFGTAAGEALADLATGRTPRIDVTGFRLSRFTDGTPLRYHA